MSQNLNSSKGGYIGDDIGDYYKVIKGDTGSLDYSSYVGSPARSLAWMSFSQWLLAGNWHQNHVALGCKGFKGDVDNEMEKVENKSLWVGVEDLLLWAYSRGYV